MFSINSFEYPTFPTNLNLSYSIHYNIYNNNEFNFTINMNIKRKDQEEYNRSYVGYYLIDTMKLYVKEKNSQYFINEFYDGSKILVPNLFHLYIFPSMELVKWAGLWFFLF